jgi:hypothetical protein
MKTFKKLTAFIRRRYIALVILYTTFLARKLDKSLQHLVILGAIDLADPLFTIRAAPRPAQPTVTAVPFLERKQVQIPYVPSWVAASFKDPSKHPGFNGTPLIEDSREVPDFLKKNTILNPTVEAVVTEVTPSVEETNSNK